ncbi:glycosyltransferase family 4 protein [bacterium]|nr:glycosyltransferase family 4 protein [candidate division CSSED10-310 bacterium]
MTGLEPNRKTVGIDIRKLQDFGIGSYVRHLLQGPVRETSRWNYVLFHRREYPGGDLTGTASLEPINRSRRLPWQGRLKNRQPVHAYHAPHYLSPDPYPVPLILTIHDLIHLNPPPIPRGIKPLGKTPGRSRDYLKMRYHRILAETKLKRMVRQAGRIISVSGATGRDMIDILGINPDRITIIHNCIDSVFFADHPPETIQRLCESHGLRMHGYFLYCGNNLIHKNIAGLLEAWKILKAECSIPPVLAVSGPRDGTTILHRARELGIDKQVRLVPPQDFTVLPLLYRGASALVLPSLAEGFGLPAAEALACRIPVICSDIPVLREITRDHAIFFNPREPGSIASKIHRFIVDSPGRIEADAEGRAIAEAYRPARFSRAHREVYGSILGESGE